MLVDTNVLIYYLNGDPVAVNTLSQWKKDGRDFFISAISVAEILSLQRLSELEISKIKNFLENFFVIPFDSYIAEQTGFFRRSYNFEIPDAGIAATAFLNNIPLITKDKKLKRIKEITVINI